MPKVNFKLSDDEKFNALMHLLNPEVTEEGDWTVSRVISAVYDDYALVFDCAEGCYIRAYYSKNDEKDMIELGEMVKCYIVDVTEQEKSTLETLRALNGGTYELVSDVLTDAQKNFEQVSEFSTKIEELNETIATLSSEKESANAQIGEFTAQLDEAQGAIASLNEELDALKQYKLNIETQQKNSVIEEYAEHLADEILDAYREKIDDYTVESLDKELAYELKKNSSSFFTKDGNDGYVPKDVPLTGIDAILSKYKK